MPLITKEPLARTFASAAALNTGLAVANFCTVLLIVRWFGAATYTSYIIDLATLGLLLIVLEVVPSNYALFRVQDEPEWLRCVAAQLLATVFVVPVAIAAVGFFLQLFDHYSPWMSLYAATLAGRRFLDIRLQSAGRLKEFLSIEASSAVVRLVLLGYGFVLDLPGDTVVWSSIAISGVFCQTAWFFRNPGELTIFRSGFDTHTWVRLRDAGPAYVPYYFGIALKRVRDNVIPLLAGYLFTAKEAMAMFFLAYRGTVFAVGQIRIIESLLNHRMSLFYADRLSSGRKALIAVFAQLMCIVTSCFLLLFSGVADKPWGITLLLSFLIWPIVFGILERAKAYSSFAPARVNFAMAAYISTAFAGSVLLKSGASYGLASFACVLICAEIAGYVTIHRFR
jgi:hypothetical protein